MGTTWNPADKNAQFLLSGGNLIASDTASGATWVDGRATDSHATGKWYFEITVTANGGGSNGQVAFGVGNGAAALTGPPGSDPGGACYYPLSGLTFIGGGTGTIQADSTNGHVGQVAVDLGAKLIWWKINVSNWNNNGSANPATGVGGLSFAFAGPYFPFGGLLQAGIMTANFGDSALFGTVPSGFAVWSPGGGASIANGFFGL